jgi:hypothetical protein
MNLLWLAVSYRGTKTYSKKATKKMPRDMPVQINEMSFRISTDLLPVY